MEREERNNISAEALKLLTVRAEKYKQKSKVWPNLKTVYQILDEECDKPAGHNQSIMRYIAGDYRDTFDVVLN